MSKNEILGKDFKLAVHLPAIEGVREDGIFVKEQVYYSDGTVKPEIKIVKNFKRPYYITKKHYRNHKDKKEYEDLDKVEIHYSTESDLAKNIYNKLDLPPKKKVYMRDVKKSPFVYGIEVPITTIMKYIYRTKWEKYINDNQVCVLDIETSMSTDEICLTSVCLDNKLTCCLLKSWLGDDYSDDIEDRLKKMYLEYIPETPSGIKNKIYENLEYKVFDSEIELIKYTFQTLHKWKPDIVLVWNIEYDIPYIMERLDLFNTPYTSVFCDPDVPEEYKYFEYKRGPKTKVTESGKSTPIDIHAQWHYVVCTASYMIMDGMQIYNYNRAGESGVVGGYSLDNILRVELNLGKLSFNNVPNIKGAEWHIFMQDKRKLEYAIYNNWDDMGIIELEKKNQDATATINLLCENSELHRLNSGPKKIVDDLHFYYLSRGKVLGTIDSDDEFNENLGLKSWIATLPAFRMTHNGLCVVKDAKDIKTNIRSFVYDSDAVSAYPSAIQAANVSKETTLSELLEVGDLDADVFKLENINLITSGSMAAVDYATIMMGFPSLYEVFELYEILEIKPTNNIDYLNNTSIAI